MSDKVGSDDFLIRILKIRDELSEKVARLISQLISSQENTLKDIQTIEDSYKRETKAKRENLDNLLMVRENMLRMQSTSTQREDLHEQTYLIDKQIQLCRESISSKRITLDWHPDLDHVLSAFCKLNVTEALISSAPNSNSGLELSGYALNIDSENLSSPPVVQKTPPPASSPELSNYNTSTNSESAYTPHTADISPRTDHSPSNEQLGAFDTRSNSMQTAEPRVDLVERYMSIKAPLHAACSYGAVEGQLTNPRGVAIDRQMNRIYVADRANERVQVFSDTGEFVFGFTHFEMKGPKGICIEENLGLVFLTLCDRNAIHSYTLEGDLVRNVGFLGCGPNQFNQPCGIDTDSMCRVYVCDFGNDRIQVFSSDFRYLTVLTNKVTKPTDVKVIEDRVYVLDRHKFCISIFSRGGAFFREIIEWGPEVNQVKHPYFFDVDSWGNFLISDLWNNCIKVFSPHGKFLCNIGSGGEDPGQFQQPSGIALVEECIVTVCERDENQLQIFQF